MSATWGGLLSSVSNLLDQADDATAESLNAVEIQDGKSESSAESQLIKLSSPKAVESLDDGALPTFPSESALCDDGPSNSVVNEDVSSDSPPLHTTPAKRPVAVQPRTAISSNVLARDAAREIAALRAELEEKSNEVLSLTQVWHESRAKLTKMQARTVTQSEAHAAALAEAADRHAIEWDAVRARHATEMEAADAQWRSSIARLEAQLADTNAALTAARTDAEATRAQLLNGDARVDTAQQTITSLENECDRLNAMQSAAAEAHASLVRKMREEYLALEKRIDDENRAISTTRQSLTSRESSLELNQVEYTNALAAAHRELEEKTLRLQKCMRDLSHLESQRTISQSEVNQLQEALANEKRSVSDLQLHLKEQTVQLSALQDQCSRSQLHNERLQAQVELQQKLNNTRPASDAPLPENVAAMAEKLFAQQTQAENLISEKNALRMQYDQEFRKNAQLKAEVQRLQAQIADDIDDEPGADLERGLDMNGVKGGVRRALRSRGVDPPGSTQTPSSNAMLTLRGLPSANVAEAITLLDSIGLQLGRLMRGRPQVRAAVVLYIILVHLWVTFVFYHIIHHDMARLHPE